MPPSTTLLQAVEGHVEDHCLARYWSTTGGETQVEIRVQLRLMVAWSTSKRLKSQSSFHAMTATNLLEVAEAVAASI